MFARAEEVLEFVKIQEIKQIDIKVIDLQGRWRRMIYSAAHLTERFFEEGTGISLSPYPGYRNVESGDMKVRPDVTTGFLDPFHSVPTLSFICDILNNDGTRYERDPRHILQKAEGFLAKSKLGGSALFSPELEFYVFDNANYGSSAGSAYWSVESHGVSWGESDEPLYRATGMQKIGQADIPLDRHTEVREQMVARIEQAGIKVKYHHHELGTPGQAEIEVYFDTPVRTADAMMIMKYMIKNTAIEYGKIITFMPKPLYGHAGNGIHYHQYIAKGDKSLFFDKSGYGGLSNMALSYLAGILHHTPALMGLGNASTNSYRRFSPNLAAPVKLFFSLSNRSSAVRIPGYAVNEREARIEYRIPDATANPYLIIAAQLMAGLDGIRGKMDPTAMGLGPFDVNVFSLPKEELEQLQNIPTSFGHALRALDEDRSFLTEAGVFCDELLTAWIQLKHTMEIAAVHERPHPFEYELYFDL
ncbi:MAG: type I glutamate--ammonia ligase [Pseudomonadota bacterium]